MSSELFRKQATDAFHSPDARGGVLTIAPPWSLVVFVAMTAIFVVLLGLAIFGRARVYAEGRGVVQPDQPLVVVRAPLGGTVASVQAQRDARGRRGQPLLAFDVRSETAQHKACVSRLRAQKKEYDRLEQRLATWDRNGMRDAALALVVIAESRQARYTLRTTRDSCDQLAKLVARSRVPFPVDATVASVAVAPGSQVHKGDKLATLVPASARLVGYVGVPEAERSQLRPGRAVRLKFDALPYDTVGVGSGTITRVLDALPPDVKLHGASQAYAEIAIDRMPADASARRGMAFTADIFTRDERVWEVLFGGRAGRR